MKTRSANHLGFVSFLLAFNFIAVLPIEADGCVLVNRAVADQAVEKIQQAGAVVSDNWFSQIRVEKAEWEREGFLYRVLINGELRLDLSKTYLLSKKGDQYQSLGWMLSDYCGMPDSPQHIPAQPMSPTELPQGEPEPGLQVEPMIGILEVSSLLGGFSEGFWQEPDGRSIAVYAQPSTFGDITARIPDTSRVERVEYSYESPGVVALERNRDWFRIQLQPQGTGWIQPSDHQDFHPLEDLIRDGLSYLKPEWDGSIYAGASLSSARRTIDPAWRRRLSNEISIEALETKKVNGELWIKLALQQESACSGRELQPFATGWVPAHTSSGQTTVWFHSRGC